MATKYTLDDVKKKIADSGYYMSDADMKLAERNPDAAMSILNYKDDYANAKTDEARALANMGAENIRKTYGGYTGGVDGSNFYLSDPTPSSFNSGTAPTFSSNYTGEVQSSYDALKNYKPFEYDAEAPSFNDKYAGQRDELVSQLTNPEKFSYDPSNDESYKAYAKQYAREGQRATADTMAAASAQSGGIASSYALTAAQQQGNYYASQLADKIPELYQYAYNRYLNDYNMKREALNSLQSETSAEYDRYLGDVNTYNADRNFAYQKYNDDYNKLRYQLSDAQALENQDYNRYRDSVSDYQNDRNFRYQQLLDTISNNQYEDEKNYSRAQDQANFRDYTGLEGYGFNMNAQRAQDKLSDEYSRLQLGSGYADLGDYGSVDRLGIDTTNLREDRKKALEQALLENQLTQKQIANYDRNWADDEYSRQLQLAEMAAESGDFSKLKALGIDTSSAERAYALKLNSGSGNDTSESTASDAAKLYKAIADYSAGKATEEQYDILIRAGVLSADALGNSSGSNGSSARKSLASSASDISGNDPMSEMLSNALKNENLTANGQYSGSYADAQNNLLTRNEWNALKLSGSKNPNITDYNTYDEYFADIKKYISQYYGG